MDLLGSVGNQMMYSINFWTFLSQPPSLFPSFANILLIFHHGANLSILVEKVLLPLSVPSDFPENITVDLSPQAWKKGGGR